MHHVQIWRDINDAVHNALRDRLDVLDETDLIERSDALLVQLPTMGSAQPTTALLLRRYHVQLHQELCQGTQPRSQFATLTDELREMTRAVAVTIGAEEGISVDNTVLIALVLYKRGLASFCTMPQTAGVVP